VVVDVVVDAADQFAAPPRSSKQVQDADERAEGATAVVKSTVHLAVARALGISRMSIYRIIDETRATKPLGSSPRPVLESG
jgi:hypothetical protein